MSDSAASGIKQFAEFYAELEQPDHAKVFALAATRSRSDEALRAQRQHLLDLYRGAEPLHSFVDETGQIFDCFLADEQPSLKKQNQPLATPPGLPAGAATKAATAVAVASLAQKYDRFGNSTTCPPGTVAVRRITLEELARFETLGHYLRKHGHPRSNSLSRRSLLAPAQEVAHQYAHAFQSVANVGGQSVLNVWSPPIRSGQVFSLSQQWYSAPGPRGIQTVEVGWQVYPELYGHAKPVLFTYWTGDGYQSTGSYGTTAGEFVQYGATRPVGMALPASSVSGGQQIEIALIVVFHQGNWWIYLDGEPIGYYPGTLFQDGPLALGAASSVDFGGETVGSSSWPPMGSGEFAERGHKLAAYQRSVSICDPATTNLRQAELTPSQDWPNSYNISLGSSADWGEFFFFGGPGSEAPQLMSVRSTGLTVYGPKGLRIEGASIEEVARLVQLLAT